MPTSRSHPTSKSRPRAKPCALAALLVLALLPGLGRSAFGFTFVPVADEALVDRAPVVALVDVSEAAEGRLRVRALSVLKGSLPGSEIEIDIPGEPGGPGEAADTDGVPRFTAGGRALLFLDPLPTGRYRLHQLALGAFREVAAEGRRYAVRDLAAARTLTADASGKLHEAAASDTWRDFDAFARFVGERARGGKPRADYLAEAPKAAPPGDAGDAGDRGGEGTVRWFEFDSGGSVSFQIRGAGSPGLPAVAAAFAAALGAWNDDAGTAVDLRYAGRRGDFGPPGRDGESALYLGDPEGWLTPFSCAYGGVVALTVKATAPAPHPFRGNSARRLIETDIVLNRGVDCFFATNGAPGAADALLRELLAHEVGHALGLRHACGDAASGPCLPGSSRDHALLRAQLHNDGRGARLAAEDRAALAGLYGTAGLNGFDSLDAAPAPPAGLVAHARTVGAVALAWQAPARGGRSFEIEAREMLSGTFARVATAPAEATGWVVTGLLPETGYVFRVRTVGGVGTTGGIGAGDAAGPSSYSNEAAAATSGETGPCLPDDHALCLNRGRFRVRARFATGVLSGAAGAGPVASDESGLFWFFTPGNWELALKVLDGCHANGHYWVFFAALTRVEHTVTVTDTWTGLTKAYWSAAGAPAPPVADAEALAVCP